MAFFAIHNVQIDGVISCVPKKIQTVSECECLSSLEAEKLSKTTGIFERRISDPSICTSDLCFAAAERLLGDLKWDRQEIEALVFVTQTPDYQLPATSPLLQQRLGLGKNCFTLDISLGCSGYIYGLTTLARLMANGDIKKGLLLVGDTITKSCSPLDKSTYPLFGDAGTATALSFNSQSKPMFANLQSDGAGYKTILIEAGGSRNPIQEGSLTQKQISPGIIRSDNQLALEGMDVFSFGITKAPEVIQELLERFKLRDSDIDYYVFHQANMMMNEKIRKKLQLDSRKVPYSLNRFGNTSCATIPHTMATELSNQLTTKAHSLVLCGFGVGLSWGAIFLHINQLISVRMIEHE